MVLLFLQLVQCRDEQALWKLRQKLEKSKPRKCERHRKVDVSAMRHRAHEPPESKSAEFALHQGKERTSHYEPNRKNGAKQWPNKQGNQTKNTTNELWNLIEAESNKIRRQP